MDEIKVPLDKLDINSGKKSSFKEDCDLIITAVTEQMGKAKKIKVPFSNDKGRKFTLVCEDQKKRKSLPTLEDKIHTLNAAPENY